MNDFTFQGPVSEKAQILSIVGSAVLVVIIIILIKKDKLRSGYSILWFLVSGAIFTLSVFADLLYWFSELTGIYYAPAAIFSVLIVGLILIEINFSVIATKQDRKIKKLAQEIGLIKEKMDRMRRLKKQ